MTMQKKWILWSAVFLLTSALTRRAPAQPSMPPPAPQPAKTVPARQTYRVVYVLTESEEGKFLGSQHAELLVSTETSTELKLGTKVPLLVGSPNPSLPKGADVQYQYIDVGLNIDARLTRVSDSIVDLHTNLEQSSIEGLEKASVPGAPIVRQAKIVSDTVMTEGKPLVIESIDLPGSNHHLRIEATVTRVQ